MVILKMLAFLTAVTLFVLWLASREDDRKRPWFFLGSSAVAWLFFLVLLGITVIGPREVGVVFNVFRGLSTRPLYSGVHFMAPLINQVTIYPISDQVYSMAQTEKEAEKLPPGVTSDGALSAPTREGLIVDLDLSVIFAINPEKAPEIHRRYGKNYTEIFVRPLVRSIVRHHVSRYTAEAIYGPDRLLLQEEISRELQETFESSGFFLRAFVIRNVRLPSNYADAIVAKMVAQQEAARMEFVLQREKLEAERKKIAAQGDAEALIQKARGEAEALKIVGDVIAVNPHLANVLFIEKLSPQVRILVWPGQVPLTFALPLTETVEIQK